MKFILNEEQISNNWSTMLTLIEKFFPGRKESLLGLYESFGDRIAMAPASSRPIHHNAFPGGYVDHVLRVMQFSKTTYDLWKNSGVDVTGFTLEELMFAALNHDLGKVGFDGDGGEYYLPNDNNWEIEKKQQFYKMNNDIPWMSVPDMSLFLLQKFGVPCTWNEWHAIKIHDGMYDDANKQYYANFYSNGKFKTSLPWILHHADTMAMRYEYENHYLNLEKK